MKNIFLLLCYLAMLPHSIAQSINQDSFSLTEATKNTVKMGTPINVMIMPTVVTQPNGEKQFIFKQKIQIREVPAQYLEEQVKLAPSYTVMLLRKNAKVTPSATGEVVQLIPPRYDTIFEKVKIREVSEKWVKKKFDRGCLSLDTTYKPFAQTFVLIQLPSLFVQAKWYKCVENAKIIRKKGNQIKIDTIFPPSDLLDVAHFPAQYKIIHRKINNNDFIITGKDTFCASLNGFTMSEKGTFMLREVICSINSKPHGIRDLQIALKLKGYYSGKIDNIFGATTKKALIQFQKEHGLSVGSLDMETITTLGVFPEITDGIHEEDDMN